MSGVFNVSGGHDAFLKIQLNERPYLGRRIEHGKWPQELASLFHFLSVTPAGLLDHDFNKQGQ